jgi:hypothetical protein
MVVHLNGIPKMTKTPILNRKLKVCKHLFILIWMFFCDLDYNELRSTNYQMCYYATTMDNHKLNVAQI